MNSGIFRNTIRYLVNERKTGLRNFAKADVLKNLVDKQETLAAEVRATYTQNIPKSGENLA